MLRTTISGQGPGPWLPWRRLKSSLRRRQHPISSVHLPRVNRSSSPVHPVPKTLKRGRFTIINADQLSQSLVPTRSPSSLAPAPSFRPPKLHFVTMMSPAKPKFSVSHRLRPTVTMSRQEARKEEEDELSQWNAS